MKQNVGLGLLVLSGIIALTEISYGWIIVIAIAIAIYLLQTKRKEDAAKNEVERREQRYQKMMLLQRVAKQQYERISRPMFWGGGPEKELFVVKKQGKFGVINEQGDEILPCEYDFIDNSLYELGIFSICVKKDGLISQYRIEEKEFGPWE